MSDLDPEKGDIETFSQVRDEIFGRHPGAHGIRFTQDSPILPDVWLAFARCPGKAHDVLINPCRGRRSGEVARDMRRLLRKWRDNAGTETVFPPARIAHVPGLIAARLNFAELMRIVLPSTLWWKNKMAELADAMPGFDLRENAQKRELFEPAELRQIASWIAALWPQDARERTTAPPLAHAQAPPPYDFLKFIRLAAIINHADSRENSTGTSAAEQATQSFQALFKGWPSDPRRPPTEGSIFNVTLNRRAEAMIRDSVRAMKADAGWSLFDVSCRKVRWAVIDSGVDAMHPAFAVAADDTGERHTPPHDPALLQAAPALATRVVKTYDLAELRMIVSLEFLHRLGHRIDPPAFPPPNWLPAKPDERMQAALEKVHQRLTETAATRDSSIADDDDDQIRNLTPDQLQADRTRRFMARQVRLLLDRIDAGLETDWASIEPLIEDVTPTAPENPHGTQVAGVLAADWPERDLVGVCRDIRLVDLRVLSTSGDDDAEPAAHDFEVISALKFIGYLNSRADEPYVHGANISIAIEHDVARFACGRTLVCEEAERLVHSGVVVVAAAGNSGYADAGQHQDRYYRSASITDPGNAEAVITVGATHRDRPHQYGVSYFSSRGPTGDGRHKPDLVAPGEKITTISTGRSFTRVDGTSFAAPHVSGAAAMLMARHTELIGQPGRIKQILCNSATCLGRERYYQGAGMLDVLRALQSI